MANPKKSALSLSTLEKKVLKKEKLSPAKKKALKTKAVSLIGTLGYGAMAKEVEQGKHSAEATFRYISTMKGITPERRRIAKLGLKAATHAGI
jgi:hypothetical protein